MPIEPRYLDIQGIFYKVYLFIKDLGLFSFEEGSLVFNGYRYIYYLKVFLIFVSLVSTYFVIDFLYRLFALRKQQQQEMMEKISANIPEPEMKNTRWAEVQRLVNSTSESDWKLAIIESDKMLDDLLGVLGYQGDTIGDKLLQIEKGDMQSLDDAWEAHKYRNRIAHESGFQISHRDAKKVIGLYENVFREYQFV